MFLFTALILVGKAMESKVVRKRYFIYVVILFSQLTTFQILSIVLNIGLVDTWLAFIGVNVIFITIFIMLFDIARIVSPTNKKLGNILRIVASASTALIVLASIGNLIIGF